MVGNSKLNEWFPHAISPVVICAPMFGVSNGALAAEVTRAGGLGMIAAGYIWSPDSPQLTTLASELSIAREALGLSSQPEVAIPVGVGFILCHPSMVHFEATVLPILEANVPRAVWLFAQDPDLPTDLIPRVVSKLHALGVVVFSQVGTVAAARRSASDGVDVIVAQGVDAGGHQNARGAGVVTLVPEVVEMVASEFKTQGREIVVVAAGGIVDGRGVAAVLALGAEAAVMGTRFLAATDTNTPEFRRKLVLEATDGGVSTIKSNFHDDIQDTAIWPRVYDGRAIVGPSYQDFAAGVPLEENLGKYSAAQTSGDMSRLVTWAGTGVGLIKERKTAGEIVKEAREVAKETIRRIQSIL
ncbi:hypothetical protein B0T17DRAFT_540804 [Bombardia bombarda]|uniref:Nitronate monooxygenase domain-containing protein n=1 Tax=Bombardia bombarda TaxID=252184 RepID=A0AA39WGM4_9PEZI|nr:hypothetical protein B0T17DRAFT_540804 [Bombardia bombarda]